MFHKMKYDLKGHFYDMKRFSDSYSSRDSYNLYPCFYLDLGINDQIKGPDFGSSQR